jgi:hypothetical protein
MAAPEAHDHNSIDAAAHEQCRPRQAGIFAATPALRKRSRGQWLVGRVRQRIR